MIFIIYICVETFTELIYKMPARKKSLVTLVLRSVKVKRAKNEKNNFPYPFFYTALTSCGLHLLWRFWSVIKLVISGALT